MQLPGWTGTVRRRNFPAVAARAAGSVPATGRSGITGGIRRCYSAASRAASGNGESAREKMPNEYAMASP